MSGHKRLSEKQREDLDRKQFEINKHIDSIYNMQLTTIPSLKEHDKDAFEKIKAEYEARENSVPLVAMLPQRTSEANAPMQSLPKTVSIQKSTIPITANTEQPKKRIEKKQCTIKGCGKWKYAQGLCLDHAKPEDIIKAREGRRARGTERQRERRAQQRLEREANKLKADTAKLTKASNPQLKATPKDTKMDTIKQIAPQEIPRTNNATPQACTNHNILTGICGDLPPDRRASLDKLANYSNGTDNKAHAVIDATNRQHLDVLALTFAKELDLILAEKKKTFIDNLMKRPNYTESIIYQLDIIGRIGQL